MRRQIVALTCVALPLAALFAAANARPTDRDSVRAAPERRRIEVRSTPM